MDDTTQAEGDTTANPGLFLNTELSLLAFQERVIHQATREDIPLLERLRFLTISVTNLDEFFEVRASAVRQQATYGLGYPGPDGRTPREVLRELSMRAHALVAEQYRVLNEVLLPALRNHGIRVLGPAEWTPEVRGWARSHFCTSVLPILSATALDPARPFPNIVNKRITCIVELSGQDAFERDADVAIVPIPGAAVLARIIPVPREVAGGPWDFVLLSDVIETNIDALFPGMTVKSVNAFRLTRNSDLWVDEEEVEDLLMAIAGELPRRDYGDAVRLEVEATMPDHLASLLLEEFDLQPFELYRTNGPVNLHRVSALHGAVALPHLKFPPFLPGLPARLAAEVDVFAAIRGGDVLLHHPYQSFQPVLDFIQRAARDPHVVAIRMTLYRTGGDSPIVESLIEAARRGKDVSAIVELRARFDEKANIDVAQRLKGAGVNVAYGVVGRKTHAKLMLVTRREGERLRSYVHLSTGNYHARTATAYTDFGLLTADEELVLDVAELFRQLTGLGRLPPPRKLVTAPFALNTHFMTLIDAEIDAAREGRPAWIKARMNSLADPGLIEALYRASMAGVEIDLVVRGICTLRPGMPGLSDRIRVRSIVGRFLEHARVYAFAHGGIWLASADWLPRNLHRRVEVCFPVSDPALAARLFDEALALPLADAVDAWTLDMDGVWRRLGHGQPARTAHGLRAQQALLARHTAGAGLARGPESRLASRPELPPPPPPMAIGTSASFEGLVPRGPGRLPSDLEGPSRGTRAEP